MNGWPTGPIAQPADLPAPERVPMPDAAPAGECADRDCVTCQVARVGAATICSMVGVAYDDLPREAQSHYEAVATEVMAAMSEELIRLGVARVPGGQG